MANAPERKHARRKRMEKRYQIINGKVSPVDDVDSPKVESKIFARIYFPKQKIIRFRKNKSTLIIKLLCGIQSGFLSPTPKPPNPLIPKKIFRKKKTFACAFFLENYFPPCFHHPTHQHACCLAFVPLYNKLLSRGKREKASVSLKVLSKANDKYRKSKDK